MLKMTSGLEELWRPEGETINAVILVAGNVLCWDPDNVPMESFQQMRLLLDMKYLSQGGFLAACTCIVMMWTAAKTPLTRDTWHCVSSPIAFWVGASQVAQYKESGCQCRRRWRHGFNSWVGKIPWRDKWQPTPVFLPGESPGQRSLVGYSP